MKEFEIQKEFIEKVINDRNGSIYGKLVFNNIENTCSKAFPIGKSLIKDRWETLIEEFIKNASFSTPYLWEIPKEFIDFCRKKDIGKIIGAEYLYDLLKFEWLEIELFNTDFPNKSSEFSWDKKMFISKTASLQTFEYPVHRLGSLSLDELEHYKGKYYLLLYNSPEDLEISYFEITPFLYEFLSVVGTDTNLSILKKLSEKYGIHYEEILKELEEFLVLLVKEKVLV